MTQTSPHHKILSADIIARKTEHKGFRTLETLTLRPQSLKHDGLAPDISREVMICGHVVSVLLYHPETDQILLNQQFRVGALLMDDPEPFLFECCMGMVDQGEDFEATAHREAFEETGATIKTLEKISSIYPSPGCLAEVFHLYLGRIEGAEVGIFGEEHEGEEIKTHLLPADDVIHMLDTGRIRNAATAVSLHWFARHKQHIRNRWGLDK